MYNKYNSDGGQTSSGPAALINAISKFPQEWALTPCIGKRNLWPNWNKTKLDRARLIEAIRSQTNHEGKKTLWTGVSIVTGPLSGGLMAIDFDGRLAWKKYLELSGDRVPPMTKHWTSGKDGHFQILLSVPHEKWEGLKHKKIELDNNEKLELRWNECSTLPPSIHPDTRKPYTWVTEEEVAECPDFILDLMRDAPAIELPQKPKPENPTYLEPSEKSLVEILENEILPRLDAEEFYGQHTKLKSVGKNLQGLCPLHTEKSPSFTVTPELKTFYCFGCCVGGGPVQFLHQIKGGTGSPTGKEFAEVVRELAGKVGVQMPEFQPRVQQNQKPNNQNHKTNNQPSNVLTHPKFDVPDAEILEKEIAALFESDLKRSQIQLKISELAKFYRLPSSDIWKIYKEQEREQEQEDNREDVAVEVARLLEIKQSKIELSEILPAQLAEPIERLAKLLNLKPEYYLAALLTQVSALFKVGTEILLRRDTNYRCTPNYFCAGVGESSQKKSPVMKAMLTLPMKPLQDKARKEYEEACEQFEEALNAWTAERKEDRGPKPKEPRQRIYHFSKTTGEGILYQVQAHPDQALMYRCDELAGLFKSGNQYRGGKGSDDEDLLEFWNGTGSTVLRAKGVAADLDGLLLSVFGTIQPDVLAGLLNDCSDSNGKFARFDFIVQPLAASTLPEEDTELPDTITPILSSLYKKVDALPKLEMELDRDAKKLFTAFYNATEQRRVAEPRQGTRAMLGKMPEKVGKMAAIIHTINCVVNGVEVDLLIPRGAVEAAIKFVKFSSDQVISLYTEFSDRSALAPNLMKIIQAAERQGGKISTREAQHVFQKKDRPTAQIIREWFSELQEMKYGEITTVKKSVFLTLTTTTVTTVASNVDTARANPNHSTPETPTTVTTVNAATVVNCGLTVVGGKPQLESLPDKDLKPTVVTVVAISPPSEKSGSLLLSYLTEPAEFAEQIRKAIANFDHPLAVKIANALRPKLELRNQVRVALTGEEFDDFRMLATVGVIKGSRVKYIGAQYSEQYEGIELVVYSIDKYSEIDCVKPDGYLTSRFKPEDLQAID